MKNISFDNPLLLLLIIPFALMIIIPFLICRNKDNKAATWTISTFIHLIIIALVMFAVAGISSTSLLTETEIYVVADISHSSERNLDQIDEYIAEIQQNLPEKTKLGVVCFGKDQVLMAKAGRTIGSVKDVTLNDTGTNIAEALNFTEKKFSENVIKKIILITDGNDTTDSGSGAIASTVEKLVNNGIKIDAIFLDNTLKDDETEIQLLEPEFSKSAYTGDKNEVIFLVQSSIETDFVLKLYSREKAMDGQEEGEYEFLDDIVVIAEKGLNTIRMNLPAAKAGIYEYKAVVEHPDDIEEHNNARLFTQEVVGDEKILLITGSSADKTLIESLYGDKGEIKTYVVGSSGKTTVPFTVEDLMEYDEIVLSNVDVRNINNANAFIDSLDAVVSQYGKSLVTIGDLQIQSNPEDKLFKKFSEFLPITYGKTARDGKLYTIVLDVSDSMFMASKFFAAKEAAIKLISVLDEDDYVCLVTFSGEVRVQNPKKVGECKQDLMSYINGLSTTHGTDLAMGLEEALKAVEALKLEENQIMVISDGFSFDNNLEALDISYRLAAQGAVLSAMVTYIPADGEGGREMLSSVVSTGTGKLYTVRRPEDVDGVLFGSVSTDFSEAVVNRPGTVNIVRYKDGIVDGIDSFPAVAGFITSLQKYDATVPITITYNKNDIRQETVPLYAYRQHGNGRVVSLTTSLTGKWTAGWSEQEKAQIIENLFVTNTPSQRHDYPYTVEIARDDKNVTIEIIPTTLDVDAKVQLVITYPYGETYRTVTRTLKFDKNKFSYSMQTSYLGVYNFDITYTSGKTYAKDENGKQVLDVYGKPVLATYTSNENFEITYVREYDEFVVCDKYNVYKFIRELGTITEGEIPNLENDATEVTTYKESYRAPFIIAAIALFVIDIFVRKLKTKKKGTKVKAKGEK